MTDTTEAPNLTITTDDAIIIEADGIGALNISRALDRGTGKWNFVVRADLVDDARLETETWRK